MGPEGEIMGRRRAAVCALVVVLCVGFCAAASGGLGSITAADLKEWLTYVASDELEGRDTYSAGLGLAAGYIQEHLRAWRVKPGGDHDGYLQIVRVLGVKTTSHSSVTVRVGRDTRTFKDGEGVEFPKNSGVRRAVTVDRVEFVGYGLDAPGAGQMDFRGKDVKGAAGVWLGPGGHEEADAVANRRLLAGRSRYATDQRQAVASVSPEAPVSGGGRGGGANGQAPGNGRGRGAVAGAAMRTARTRREADAGGGPARRISRPPSGSIGRFRPASSRAT